jgi:uncharacterized protein YbjT (DUF2867 family)
MAAQRTIAVVGATGAQGGGLVRAIAKDESGEFRARALTRDPDSEKARALARLPAVEVVKADLDDPASVEAAFRDVYGAYCVTFFWADFSTATEMRHARTMAAAAKATGVEHVIWSTLEDTREWVKDDRMPTLHGRYKVPHYDGKGEADAAFREAGLPATFLRTSAYWENLIYFGLGPQRGQDGLLVLAYPLGEARWPGMASEDIGKIALGIFKRGAEFIGKTVSVAGEHLTGRQLAEKLSIALGEEVRYYAMEPDAYRSLGFPGADLIGNMFHFKRDFEAEYAGPRDVALARSLNPELKDFDAWLGENANRIPLGAPVAEPAT